MPAFRVVCVANSIEEAKQQLEANLRLGVIQIHDETPLDLMTEQYAMSRYCALLAQQQLIVDDPDPISGQSRWTLSPQGRQMTQATLS